MVGTLQTLLLLVGVVAAAAVVARRLDIAPSILLVVAGIALALTPGIPPVVLAPEVVLLVILPPLIYSAGVSMSWREFRFNLRPIGLLAFGCVIFTTCAVAAASYYLLGLPWAVGFVLGAIVSPPDVVAPLAIARRLGLPHRILVILEGEGLANDATALIVYRFAVAAVSTGIFSIGQAAGTFALIVVFEIAYGMLVGWGSLLLRRWAREPRVEITLSLMTPYLAYWVPEHFGGSGVLATVACGLYVSWKGPLLIPSATRLQGIFFWDLLIYLLEGIVFLVTGLQARGLIERANSFSMRDLLTAIALTTAIVIVARFVWMFPATYLPRWLIPPLARRDPSPPWTYPFIISYTGVRGVVSLAAALAVPYATLSGAPFPHRDLIVIVTFGVIVITLVGQGLTLPAVIRWLGLGKHARAEHNREREAEREARLEVLEASRKRMETLVVEHKLSAHQRKLLEARHERRKRETMSKDMIENITEACGDELLELIGAERKDLHRLLREGKITDETRRRMERELDLEEASIARRRDADKLPL